MEIGFSPFATRPAQVESADDWLGEPRDSSLPLDGPVGTPAFPVQRRADDLLPPVEESFEETRATLRPEAYSRAMGHAYGLFTEGLGGGPVGIGGDGAGEHGALTEGTVSGGDGGHAQGAPSGDPVTDMLDDDTDAGDDVGDDSPPDGGGDRSAESPDDVADMMDAPADFDESRATIHEDERDEADSFEAPSLDGVADMMDAPPEVDEGRATISDEPPAEVHVDAERFGGPGIDAVADVMDAPAEFDEGRATLSAVQAKSSGMVGRAPDIQSAAAEGVTGSGGRLPHLDKIQAAFGDHDVSGVAAHTGGKAATAARAIGASAYATGNNVAFAESPDLFTAAHEAAHVVQQRAGVQLLGGVGEADDSYERNADAVAVAVVRGESAAHLLGPAIMRSTSGVQSVQRQHIRGTIVDQGDLPHQLPAGVELPKVRDPMVSVTDQDSGECYQLPRTQVVRSASYVDVGLSSVDPQGDPWTLSVERLVFTNAAGSQFVVPWDGGVFASAARATSFELRGGTYYPLIGDPPTRTYDATNTPEISRAARLVLDVVAELKQQRVDYAFMVYMFAGGIAGLGSAKPLVRRALARGWAGRRGGMFGRRSPPSRSVPGTDESSVQGGKPKGNKGKSRTPGPRGPAAGGKNEQVKPTSLTRTSQQKGGGAAKGLTLPENGVRRPASRHRASSVKQGTVARDTNTVYERSLDVNADVQAINQGRAVLGRNAGGQLTATVNGRTYVVENNGTLSPRNGPGFTTLTRGEFQALGVFNKFGDTDRAHSVLKSMKNVTPESKSKAFAVWTRLAQ